MDDSTNLESYGIWGVVLLSIIGIIRDPSIIQLARDLFIKPHHPDDLELIKTLTEERDQLKKEKEIAEAVKQALDNPEVYDKVSNMFRSRGSEKNKS